MRADDMTCHPRHIPVVTVGPGDTERREGGPHTYGNHGCDGHQGGLLDPG